MSYVEYKESAAYNYGTDTGRILEVIAQRYMGENTKLPYTCGTYCCDGFMYEPGGRFDMSDMSSRVPDAKVGDYVAIAGMVYSDKDYSMNMYIDYKSPAAIYVDGVLWDRADRNDEFLENGRYKVMPLKKGLTQIVIEVQKTRIGFGIIFGAEGTKYHFLNIKAPFSERFDRNGFAYSSAYSTRLCEETVPDLTQSETATAYSWYPSAEWDKSELDKIPFERIFGKGDGYLYAWTKAQRKTTVSIEAKGEVIVFSNGKECYRACGNGIAEVKLGDVLIATTDESASFYGEHLINPVNTKGYDGQWIYLGRTQELKGDICNINSVVAPYEGCDNLADYLYWQVDLPNTWIRMYIEDEKLYGAWSYPLGVTMYGILKAGRLLKKDGMISYVKDHIQQVADTYRYAKWDGIKYGFPGLHQKLATMDMLDDCGSMGSTALEAGVTGEYADDTAYVIENKIERRPDGAFYRIKEGSYSKGTMWADDLYMSTPFLIRYYKLTGEQKYIDDAANQFLLFKKYLFIEEEGIMSHVYNFNYNLKTDIPWGRGNGWVAFSLSETLEFLPEDHPKRDELLEFFRTLCKNYLRLQGDSGMWHQVLNLPESYEEASCTAMFTYTFARGIRFGWLEDKELYVEAVNKGWEALKRECIDKEGNVYGVCHGSQYSYTTDYYMYELGWRKNDTHGIGIVMLAGAERENMSKNL